MKTASVRDLRNNFARISRWLKDGQKVEITSRGVPLGFITPRLKNGKPTGRQDMKEKMRKRFGPGHAAWMKKVYGTKKLPDNIVLTMREEKDW